MATSITEICNMALRHLGQAQTISQMNEGSTEADVCNQFYGLARDFVLRDYRWPFARRIAQLSVVEECPLPEWAFSFRLPADCLKVWRLVPPHHHGGEVPNRVPFETGSDQAGLLVYANLPESKIEYSARIEDVTWYTPDFVLALSLRLAGMIATGLLAGDAYKLTPRIKSEYYQEVSNAARNAYNEGQPGPAPVPESIRARD